ncbi:MAG TPA: TraR/DksA C4-type zinc finger protein [Acidimicrobiales bacterium]|nr:TraR/DksA C4-type zinc finger protein [Acidimicrobiales bacterium]
MEPLPDPPDFDADLDEVDLDEVEGDLARQILADAAGVAPDAVEAGAVEVVEGDVVEVVDVGIEEAGTEEPDLPIGAGYEQMLAEAERVLDEVDGALARLRDGTYGTCEVCGDSIADDQLEARPTARTCERHLPLPTAS